MAIVKTTNTIMGMINEYNSRFGLAYDPNDYVNFTLNSLYGIGADQLPSTSVVGGSTIYKPPTIKYVGIGNRGFYNVGDDGLATTYKPSPTNQNLYRPIPFRIRPLDEDLTASERAQYRMRTIMTISGLQYVCYWLKVMTIPTNSIDVKFVNADGQESDYNIVPNLNPTPSQIVDEDEAQNDSGSKVIVRVTGEVSITNEEIQEAVSILYGGEEGYGKISEIGVYTGEDRVLTGAAAGGGSISYTESIYTHLSLHRCSQGNSDFSSVLQRIVFGNGNLILL